MTTHPPENDDHSLVDRLDLPEEVGTREAAEILGCSKHTVLQFRKDGLLEWRNAAPPTSTRPNYRFSLRSVLELRNSYRKEVDTGASNVAAMAKRRKRVVKSAGYKAKHIGQKSIK